MPPTHAADSYTMLKRGIDDAAFMATEHQLHFASQLGTRPKWRLHPTEGTAEFITKTGTIITAEIHPIAIMDGTSWTWSWADERTSGINNAAALQVKQFGEEGENRLLTRSSYPLTKAYTRVTPEQLVALSKNIHRIWRHFIFDMPDKSRLYAAIHLPQMELPTPTAATVTQTVRKAHELFPLTKYRRSLRSYARLRGISYQENLTRTQLRLITNDGTTRFSWPTGSLAINEVELDTTTPMQS